MPTFVLNFDLCPGFSLEQYVCGRHTFSVSVNIRRNSREGFAGGIRLKPCRVDLRVDSGCLCNSTIIPPAFLHFVLHTCFLPQSMLETCGNRCACVEREFL